VKVIRKDRHGFDAEWVRSSHNTMCRTQRCQSFRVGQERLAAIGMVKKHVAPGIGARR
jgi:hypothetical protein